MWNYIQDQLLRVTIKNPWESIFDDLVTLNWLFKLLNYIIDIDHKALSLGMSLLFNPFILYKLAGGRNSNFYYIIVFYAIFENTFVKNYLFLFFPDVQQSPRRSIETSRTGEPRLSPFLRAWSGSRPAHRRVFVKKKVKLNFFKFILDWHELHSLLYSCLFVHNKILTTYN